MQQDPQSTNPQLGHGSNAPFELRKACISGPVAARCRESLKLSTGPYPTSLLGLQGLAKH